MDYGHNEEGRIGAMNSWVIETLQKDDVIVIDLFGKVYEGTFSGANLSTAIATRRSLLAPNADRSSTEVSETPSRSSRSTTLRPSARASTPLPSGM